MEDLPIKRFFNLEYSALLSNTSPLKIKQGFVPLATLAAWKQINVLSSQKYERSPKKDSKNNKSLLMG